MEVTYWVRRDLWARGLATMALGELLSVVTVRPIWARVAADIVGSARVLLRSRFMRVDEETAYAVARGAVIRECFYRLDEPSDGRVALRPHIKLPNGCPERVS